MSDEITTNALRAEAHTIATICLDGTKNPVAQKLMWAAAEIERLRAEVDKWQITCRAHCAIIEDRLAEAERLQGIIEGLAGDLITAATQIHELEDDKKHLDWLEVNCNGEPHWRVIKHGPGYGLNLSTYSNDIAGGFDTPGKAIAAAMKESGA